MDLASIIISNNISVNLVVYLKLGRKISLSRVRKWYILFI